MLFLLTGDVQTGKTRWLERTVARLRADGVEAAGVLAPGVWRERGVGEAAGQPGVSGAGRFEKLGIDNVLLPGGERLPFARRRDLAERDGAHDPASQSAAARLAWDISEDALARVNAHFAALAGGACAGGAREGEGRAPGARGSCMRGCDASAEGASAGDALGGGPRAGARDDGTGEPHASANDFFINEINRTNVSRETPAVPSAAAAASASPAIVSAVTSGVGCAVRPGLLVVDELGPLELVRGGGLTAAVGLLGGGATPAFPHALAVVRARLAAHAEERFASAWGGCAAVVPGDGAEAAVRAAFGLAPLNDNQYH